MVGVTLGCIGTLAKKRKIIGTVGIIQGLYRSYIRILCVGGFSEIASPNITPNMLRSL